MKELVELVEDSVWRFHLINRSDIAVDIATQLVLVEHDKEGLISLIQDTIKRFQQHERSNSALALQDQLDRVLGKKVNLMFRPLRS